MASVVGPLGFRSGVSWYDRTRLYGEAYADITWRSAIAQEHALKVAETNALVLDRMEDRIRGLGWDEIEARGAELHRWMQDLDEGLAQITALHLARPDGRVTALSSA